MGVIDTTSITQVIEWGKLATFVGFDTRVSYRSKDPTLGSCKSTRHNLAYDSPISAISRVRHFG